MKCKRRTFVSGLVAGSFYTSLVGCAPPAVVWIARIALPGVGARIAARATVRAALRRKAMSVRNPASTLEFQGGRVYAAVGRKAKTLGQRNARTKKLDDDQDRIIKKVLREAYDTVIDTIIDGVLEVSDQSILSLIDNGTLSSQFSDYIGTTQINASHNGDEIKTVSFSHSVYDVDTKEEFVAYDGDASYSVGPNDAISLDFDMKDAIQYCGPGRKVVISRVDGEVVATSPVVIVADL